MIWKDTKISDEFCIPKFSYFTVTCFVFFMTLWALIDVMTRTNLQDKIVIIIGSYFVGQYCLRNVFFMLMSGQYVKSIKQDRDHFILTTDYNKQFAFKLSDVLSVEDTKLSKLDKLWATMNDQESKLDLLFKNGSKYRITTDMENIDTLREYLLGKQQ